MPASRLRNVAITGVREHASGHDTRSSSEGGPATFLAQGSGQPLLLLHGLIGGTSRRLPPGHGCIPGSMVLSGVVVPAATGRRPGQTRDLIEDYGADVFVLLESRAGPPTVAFGHSSARGCCVCRLGTTRPRRARSSSRTVRTSASDRERRRTEGSFAFFESVRSARGWKWSRAVAMSRLAGGTSRAHFPQAGSLRSTRRLSACSSQIVIADFAADDCRGSARRPTRISAMHDHLLR